MGMRTMMLSLGLIWPGMAFADAIDGEWCAPDGLQRLYIEGPRITIPSGAEITGSYTRHEFLYRVPEDEPDAGTEIYMRQLSEEDVQVYRGEAAPEMWHRCQAVVS